MIFITSYNVAEKSGSHSHQSLLHVDLFYNIDENFVYSGHEIEFLKSDLRLRPH